MAGPGVVVALQYAVLDADGELIAEAGEVEEFLIGYGELLPALERGVEGMTPGERRSLILTPKDGYGERDPRATLEVDRDEFPPDVSPGDRFEAEDDGGHPVLLTVLDVADDAVVLDQNHPLAGRRLQVDVEVVGCRLAEADEIARAEAALMAETDPAIPLISPQRLLRPPNRRYEEGDHPDVSAEAAARRADAGSDGGNS